MKFDLSVSVIIPVYNAEAFVTRAVESALAQPETREVILIEDRSSDNSLAVCKYLTKKFENVKLYTHPNNENRGAGPSRNLGIEKATQDYVAFLDADDFYLPDRFRAERVIFEQKPNTDGVYGALGFHYYSESGKLKYQRQGFGGLTTVSEKTPPKIILYVFLGISSIRGYFHLDTLTIKRSSLVKTEKFSNLRLHQDTVFLIQLAYNCILECGEITAPIGLRGVHDHNRVVNANQTFNSKLLMWNELETWAKEKDVPSGIQKIFSNSKFVDSLLYDKKVRALSHLITQMLKDKDILIYSRFFNRPVQYIFGWQIGNIIIKVKEYFQMTFFRSSPFKSSETLMKEL